MPSNKTQIYNQFINLEALDEYLGENDITSLCDIAIKNTLASISVLPRHLGHAWNILKGTSIKLCSVLNFPHGDAPLQDIIAETKTLYESGADEIELVIPYASFLESGNTENVENYVNAVKDIILERKILKVNIGAQALGSSFYIHQVTKAILPLGAGFIKNSTSYSGDKTIFQINAIIEEIANTALECGVDVAFSENAFADVENIFRLLHIVFPKQANFTKRLLRFSIPLSSFKNLLKEDPSHG